MIYRYDIDGLRAVAVLAVLGFHIVPWTVPGGYIGVDIFFVISGFLITSILWRDFEAGRFSFANFYVRRIKRLFPALFAVLFTCAFIEYFVGLPDEARAFGLSAIASAFYVSNHYFLSLNDYFDDSLEINPLLHTWSLSVEEQFYIIFPALLFLIFRKNRQQAAVLLIILSLISLTLSEVLLYTNKTASFFVTPSRFWQFLIGAVIALRPSHKAIHKIAMELISIGGVCAIVLSIFFFSDTTPFPGLKALLPTLGAAMIIFGGQKPGLYISKLLSIPPARFFGKISYSLYLWHWPLIVFYKLEIKPEPSSYDRYLLIALSILLGYLSWKLIENPIRQLNMERRKFLTIGSGVLATVMILLIGLAFVVTDGGRDRFTQDQLSYLDYLEYNADPFYRTDICFLTSNTNDAAFFDKDLCLSNKSQKSNVLLVGDSHGAQYYNALKETYPSIEFSQVNASGCRPLINYQGEERCTALMKLTFQEYVKEYKFDAIILAGRWEEGDLPAIHQTIETLSNTVRQVIVLGPIIEYKQALPRLLARYDRGDPEMTAAQDYMPIEELDHHIQSTLADTNADYYSILGIICPRGSCELFTSDGMPIQFDASHLTQKGALDVVTQLFEQGLLYELIDPSILE